MEYGKIRSDPMDGLQKQGMQQCQDSGRQKPGNLYSHTIEASLKPQMEEKHCVRCHRGFIPGSGDQCRIMCGRDTTLYAVGASASIVEKCEQCRKVHHLPAQHLCFKGDHTTSNEDIWVTFRCPQTGHPSYDPEPDSCEICDGYIWENKG